METNGTLRYEIRAGSLYVNGERQVVARSTVLFAVAASGKADLAWSFDVRAIPAKLAWKILRVEAEHARHELAAALVPLTAGNSA